MSENDAPLKIRVIDAYPLNPGDLDWKPLQRLGDLRVFPRYNPDADEATDAHALLVDVIPFGARELARYPRLRYLGLLSTGYDSVDLDVLRTAGVAVTHVPAYSTASVAQMTIALILCVAHRIVEYDALVHDGGWRAGVDFYYHPAPLFEVDGATLGVLGFGSIGASVARRAHALGMRILGDVARKKDDPGVPVEWVSQEELLARSEVITLHLPLTGETRRLINDEKIAQMRDGAILINTSRGGIVDDTALAAALHRGKLGGAALDVLGDREPPARNNPLLSAPNCVITPHIAWATGAARWRCLREAATNLEAFLRGERRNRLV